MPAQDLVPGVRKSLLRSVLEKRGPLVAAPSNCGCLAGPEAGGGRGTGPDLISAAWDSPKASSLSSVSLANRKSVGRMRSQRWYSSWGDRVSG